MIKRMQFFLVFIAVLMENCLTSLSQPTISQHPQSVNTTLNNTVNFSCVGIGTHIGWYVNATVVDSINFPPEKGIEKSDTYDSDTSSSTLTVFAMESNNQSEIECFLILDINQTISEKATLLIQGVLDAPMWTDAQFVNNTLQMNWNSPYTLENVPILAYHIDVNQTHEYVCNATTTSLTVMDFSLEECFWYVLTITARNSVGQSEKNSLSLFYPGVPYQVNSEDINTTVVIMNQEINVEVNMKYRYGCSEQEPHSADVTFYSTEEETLSYTETTSISDNDTDTFSVEFININPNTNYGMSVILYNIAGQTVSDNYSIISTFDTQDIEKGKSNIGKLCLRCLFLIDTSAKGCLIHLNYYINGEFITDPLDSHRVSNGQVPDVSEWNCAYIGNEVDNVDIKVYDIELDERTSNLALQTTFTPSMEFNILPVVVNESSTTSTLLPSESTVNESIVTSTTSTLLPSESTESILQSPGNISYTFTMHSTNSSTIVATSSSSVTVTSSKDISSTQILIIASCTIGSIVLCLVFMVICLIVTIKLQRGKMKELAQNNIPITHNALYGVDLQIVNSLKNLGSVPPSHEDPAHIYSEIHLIETQHPSEEQVKPIDDWIANPTYGGVKPLEKTTRTYDEVVLNHNSNGEVVGTITDTCPAYGCKPPLPARNQNTPSINGHCYKKI